MTSADQAMRDFAASLPVPEFESTPFAAPPPTSEATVAIVTSAALHRPGDDQRFSQADTSYRLIDRSERQLVLGHWSSNFDRSAAALDLNVVFPLDRLEELAAAGVIGAVAPRHASFAGNQPDDVAELRLDSGPSAAEALRADGVDVAIFTPV